MLGVAAAQTIAPPSRPRPRLRPSTQQMVIASLKALNERNGSSMAAMKRYICATYGIDSKKLAPYIKKYLLKSVVNGKLIQTRGRGARGSFKLAEKKPNRKVAPTKKFDELFKKFATKKAMAESKKDIARKKTAAKKIALAQVRQINKMGTVKTKPKKVAQTKTKTATATPKQSPHVGESQSKFNLGTQSVMSMCSSFYHYIFHFLG